MLVESEGQADLLIKKGDEPESVFALNDVYQTTPAGDQVETQTVAPGETATYQVKVENDSTDSTEHKTFVVKATESSESGWTVTYEVGATNITGQITGSGGYTTSGLVPGGSEIITVEMTPDSTVEPGTTKSTTVQAFLDASDTTVQDAVQAITTATSIPNLTAGCTPCAEKTGEPIQTGTGEYFTDPQVDIDLGGPLPLSFSRTYASRLSLEGEVQSSLEPNWMHNFDIRLKKKSLPARTATVVYGRGNIITFQQPPQQLEWFMQSSPEDTEGTIYQLREGPNREYWFMDPNRKLVFRFYDAPSLCGKGNFSSFGLLREIQDRNGNTLSLTYDDFCNLSEVSDGLGRTLTFTYDASGHLTQLTDGTRILTYTNTDGVLTGFTDAMGNTTIYLYDTTNTAAGPLLVAIERPLGNRHHTQTYDTQGRVIQQVDAFANATTFEYDTPAPGTTTITDPLGNRRTTGHERQKVMTEATDAQGQTSSFAYDDHDRPTSSTDRLGNTTAISYQPESGLPTSMTDARGNTGGFTYTPQDQTFGSVTFTFNNLTRVDYPDGTHKEFSYDAKGNVIERVDQAGNVWTYTYNSRGQILTETNPEEGVTTSTYNDDGTLASSKDAETGATTYEYDNLKRLTNIINPDGTSIRKNYNLNNMVIFETDENGGTVSSTYDANGNIIATIDPLGNRTQYTLDSMDRQVQTMNRLGKVSTITFDPPGRLASSTDPNGNALQYRYNENGWTTQVTDGAGKVWQTGYDAEGRIISETSPLGITMRHEWDQAGKKTKVTDALGHSTSFTWDALNRMSSVTDPVGKQTQYSYDSLGNFSGITHSGLGSATYIYNALRLLTTLTDFGGKSWDFGYTPMGRLSFLRDPLGDETRFSYDPRGRLSQTQ